MGSQEQALSSSSSTSVAHSQVHVDSSVSGLHEKHLRELENLTLTTDPLKTLKYFTLAVFKCLQQLFFGIFAKRGWLMVLGILACGIAIVVTHVRGAHEEHVQELLHYLQFGLWWLALGVVSSIGFGSGLHTFVLYLGPHIALFTIKSVHCGRVDIKIAPYDTIQLKSAPSWLDRDCSEFGPRLYASPDSRVQLSHILPRVQLEAILWGIGTALGELPPYFISRAAYKSRGKSAVVEDKDSSEKEDSGIMANHLKQIKQWILSHSQHLNFFTILVLASENTNKKNWPPTPWTSTSSCGFHHRCTQSTTIETPKPFSPTTPTLPTNALSNTLSHPSFVSPVSTTLSPSSHLETGPPFSIISFGTSFSTVLFFFTQPSPNPKPSTTKAISSRPSPKLDSGTKTCSLLLLVVATMCIDKPPSVSPRTYIATVRVPPTRRPKNTNQLGSRDVFRSLEHNQLTSKPHRTIALRRPYPRSTIDKQRHPIRSSSSSSSSNERPPKKRILRRRLFSAENFI